MVGKFANDFGVYWRTANMPVEQAYLWKGRFPFPYIPTMLLWISPLSLVPKWPAFIAFVIGSGVALALALRPYLPKAAIALTLLSPPFMRGAYTGQVSALLAAIMIWACGTENRLRAGLAFGVIASVKPQLVIMAPLMLALRRDWTAFFAAAITFAAFLQMSEMLYGYQRWEEWCYSLDHFRRMVMDTNVSGSGATPAVLAEKHGLPPLPFWLVGIAAGSWLVYLCRDGESLVQATAIGAGSLLAAPYALAYDLIVIVPLLASLIMRGRIVAFLGIPAAIPMLPLGVAVYGLVQPGVATQQSPSRTKMSKR